MQRSYKLFKISSNGKEKLVKEFNTNQEAVAKIRAILGLKEFQKCDTTTLYDGVMPIGMVFNSNDKLVFEIRKEINWRES